MKTIKFFVYFIVIITVNSILHTAIPDYFPLHVGNYWKLESDYYPISVLTMEIIEKINKNSYEYYIFGEDNTFFRKEKGDIYSLVGDNEQLLYKFSGAVGDTWTYYDRFGKTRIYKIENKDIDINLSNFQFSNCIQLKWIIYEGSEPIFVSVESFAPNVGMISEDKQWYGNEPSVEFWQLIEYHLETEVVDYGNFNDNEIIISPNPASDFIEINVGVNCGSHGEIGIYDVFGRKIHLTPTLSEGEGVRIDVSKLVPGLYFVRMGAEVTKFVKL